MNKELLYTAILTAIKAAHEVMLQYKNGFTTEYKEDKSPLTTADKAAHTLILENLKAHNLPILSEEGNHFTHTERMKWNKYWVVDPIDGTKGFVNKTNEFAVCIALIENKTATMGVIAAPAKNVFYFGSVEFGAFKFSLDYGSWIEYTKTKNIDQIIEESISLPIKIDREDYLFLSSKNYKDNATNTYIKEKKSSTKNFKELSCGSAIKFGLLAEGVADEYTRLSPLSFWDIAAGDAIIKSAGLRITSSTTNKEVIYSDSEMKINGFNAFLN